MKTRKLIPFVAVAAIALTGCAAGDEASVQDSECFPAHEFSTVKDNVLTVAVIAVPNITDVDENGRLTGLEGDILNGFAEAECLVTEPVEIAGQGIIPAVHQGRVDVATGGWTETEERLKIIDFSQSTFVDTMQIISKEGYSSLEEMIDAGAAVGSPQGNWWVADVEKALGSNLRVYQDFPETLLDVSNGRIDAAIVPASSLPIFMASPEADGVKAVDMTSSPLLGDGMDLALMASLPIGKENPELKEALNAYLDVIVSDGTLDAIIEKWEMPPRPNK